MFTLFDLDWTLVEIVLVEFVVTGSYDLIGSGSSAAGSFA